MSDEDLAKKLANLSAVYGKTTVDHRKGGWANPLTHRARHQLLHEHLDELMADYLMHHPKKMPSSTTLTELMEWSWEQTIKPTPLEG